MMRLLCAVVVVVAVAPAGDPPPETQPAASLSAARDCFLRGEYDAAVDIYDQLLAQTDTAVAAAVGRAEIDSLRGTYADGVARLEAIRDLGRDAADWHAALAALLVEVGRYAEALEHNRKALDITPGHCRARWQLGSLYEYLGRDREAVETYEPFEELMTEGALPETPEELIFVGRGFYRISVLRRHPNLTQRTKHVLTEVYQEAFDVLDPAYWPGRLAAAELLLEKHNLGEARFDFEAICRQNPRVPGVHVGFGRIALDGWNFDLAQQAGETALEINPNFLPALLLLADLRMQEGRYGDAALIARRALQTNPDSIEALAVLAAAQLRMGNAEASRITQEQIEKITPRPAMLHHALGVWLCAGRQFEDARPHLEKAIEFAPTWPAPRVELGQLYLEIGEEDLARSTLDAAFAIDSFDARTHEILGLLDRLDKFARRETGHFIIRYDEEADGVIAPYFAEALEAMHPEICESIGFRPLKPTIVEVFPDHMGFSLRIGGRPFISTIGACSGRVIALCAPRRQIAPFGAYNWVEVLRHEYAHTVSMAATENRITRWFTEGLAQRAENRPRPWTTMLLLAETSRERRLTAVKDIDWAFVRPRQPGGVGLAYAQSEWMVEYIEERYGRQALLDMLEVVRAGKMLEQVFSEVLKCETTVFDQEFGTWAAEQAASWGLPTSQPAEDRERVEAELRDNPDDPVLLARLALAWLQAGELGKAKKAAREALEQDEDQPVALEVISHAFIQQMLGERDTKKREELIKCAEPYLRRLIRLDPQNPAAIKYLGYVEQAHRNWPAAIDRLKTYQHRFPADPDPYRRLVAVYLEQDRPADAIREQTALAKLVPHEPAVPRRLGDLHAREGRFDQAAAWYLKSIQADPYHLKTHRRLAEACFKASDYAGAERGFEALCRLKPNSAEGYEGLSSVLRRMNQADKAEEFAAKAAAIRERSASHAPPPTPRTSGQEEASSSEE